MACTHNFRVYMQQIPEPQLNLWTLLVAFAAACEPFLEFSAAGGPVMVKLRFEREKPRESGTGFILVAEEAELEVHASEGLEIFKFQVRKTAVYACLRLPIDW